MEEDGRDELIKDKRKNYKLEWIKRMEEDGRNELIKNKRSNYKLEWIKRIV